jgi:hypothetical protein
MTKPAVMQGVYVDCKFMAGFKVARISIDIPIEHSNEFLRMFGAPDRANPVAVAIARLDVEALNAPTVPEKAVEPAPVEEPKRKRSLREYPRSQQAGMKCDGDIDFRRWIIGGVVPVVHLTADRANSALKARLGIESKTELDSNAERGEAWDRMLTSYENRHMVR